MNWYLVANTPGVDIRHKVDGQELTLVENVNYQIANKIIRAVNSHEALLEAANNLLKMVEDDDVTTFELDAMRQAIEKAEGK